MIERWRQLWRDAGLSGNADPAGRDLLARYDEPHRHYHTLRHIEHCLDEFETSRSSAADSEVVALAVWYHDAVYDPRRADNEERSADLAVATLSAAGFPSGRVARVADLIQASAHRGVPDAGDAALFVDIDLSILGAAPGFFDEYERQIRAEYGWVDEAVFRTRRASVLEGFLARPVIYCTAHFRDRYEAPARRNLQRSLDRLRAF
jgi:predicted metal-dependent HD superfamily phosphohydrolase